MEASAKWVYSRIDGFEPAIVFQGRKFANCVVLDRPVRVYSVDLHSMIEMRPLERNGKPYPLVDLARFYLSKERSHGITMAARRLCQLIIDGKPVSEDEDEAFDAELADTDRDNPGERKSTKTVKEEINAKKFGDPPPEDVKKKHPKPEPKQSKSLRPESLVGKIAAELGIDPKDARKKLRAAGMHAPYDDESKIRATLGKAK